MLNFPGKHKHNLTARRKLQQQQILEIYVTDPNTEALLYTIHYYSCYLWYMDTVAVLSTIHYHVFYL